MLLALFADIHANRTALVACLEDARARGAERFAFLGDLVGYGPDPSEVLALIRDVSGALVIKGNHDEAVLVEPKLSEMNDLAYSSLSWTRRALSEADRAYLAGLPLVVQTGDQCLVHASANHPERFEYILGPAAAERSLGAAGVPYVFSGHVHNPALYYSTAAGKIAEFRPTPGSPIPVPAHRRWLAVVGSAGQPRDGNPRASYAIFNREAELLTFFRVPYDHLATAARIRAAGLPEILAHRIERGSL